MGIILRLLREILSKCISLLLSLPSPLSTTLLMRQPPPPPRPPPNQPQLRLSAASQVTQSPHVAANGTLLSLSLTRLAPLLSTTTHLSFNSRPTVPGPRVDD